MYYTKKEELLSTPLGRSAMHATNSLTGNWKPGGERIPHPHQGKIIVVPRQNY